MVTDPGLNLSTLPYIGINGGSPYPDNSINGSTLDFRIFGQALSSSQISALHAIGADATNAAIANALAAVSTTDGGTVDPAVAQMNSTGLGEWNTAGNFEGWTTTNVTNLTASGGTLGGTGSAAVVALSDLNIANGPALDLVFNDLLDLRLQVPTTFAGDIRVYYDSTFAAGIARMLSIPNAQISKDGAANCSNAPSAAIRPWPSKTCCRPPIIRGRY